MAFRIQKQEAKKTEERKITPEFLLVIKLGSFFKFVSFKSHQNPRQVGINISYVVYEINQGSDRLNYLFAQGSQS